MVEHRKGQCLCGAVQVSVTLPTLGVHACHCELCQKWGGAQAMALGCTSDWQIKGDESLAWYDSTEWGQRGFCKKCGTHLLFRMKDGSYHGVNAAILDDQSGLFLENHIFIDKKPDYYDFKGDAPRLTEDEFLKMIGSSNG